MDYFFSKETYLYLLNIFFIPIHNLPGVFENMTYTTINGSLWTMPVEVACYIALLIGFIICSKFKKIKKEHLIYISIIIFICIIVVFRTNSLIVSAVRHMIVFAEGILIYLKRDKIILNVKLAIILSIIFIASIFVGLLTYAIFLLLPYIVLTFTLACKQRLKNVKILNLSYEMYLIGWPIQQVIVYFMGGDMNPILNFVIAVPLDIIAAYGISKMVELIEKKLICKK